MSLHTRPKLSLQNALKIKDSVAALWILLGLYATFAILRIQGAKQRQSLFTRLPHVGAIDAPGSSCPG